MGKKRIIIKGKTFELTIPEATILEAVSSVAERVKADYAGRNPLFLVVLNGAFAFAADLLRLVDYPCGISFVKLASYDGLASTGRVREQLAVDATVEGRDVVIVEDIVERGYTMDYLINQNFPMFSQVGLRTAATAGAIAVGASMVTSIVRMLTWRKK